MISEELSDEDLVVLINAGSKSAEIALYERYFKYSYVLADDFLVEFGLIKNQLDEIQTIIYSKVPFLLKDFPRIETTFNLYWKGCARNAVLDYIKDLPPHYFKNSKGIKHVSLDEAVYGEEDVTFHDVIAEEEVVLFDNNDPLGNIEHLIRRSKNFSKEEKDVSTLYYLQGKDILEISSILKLTSYQVRYLIRTVKPKITTLIKDSYF